jgi:hypothetical protein
MPDELTRPGSATEQVSASAEEMGAQVAEVTAQAAELAHTAEQVRELVARFKLDEIAAQEAEDPTTDKLIPHRRERSWAARRAS